MKSASERSGPILGQASLEPWLWHGSCAAACGLSFFVLGWWSFSASTTTQTDLGIAMAPVTAVLTCLLGLALWRHRFTKVRWEIDMATAAACSLIPLNSMAHVTWDMPVPWESQMSLFAAGDVHAGDMSLNAAAVVLLMCLSLGLGSLPEKWRTGISEAVAAVGATVGTVLCIVSILSYSAGELVLISNRSDPPSLTGAGALCCIGFVLLLHSRAEILLRRVLFGRSDVDELRAPGAWKIQGLFALAMAAFISVTVAAFHYMHVRQERQREIVGNDLTTITELKALQISSWHKMRIANARMLMRSPTIAQPMMALAKDPSQERLRTELLAWFQGYASNYGFSSLALLDGSLKPVLSSKTDSLPDDAMLQHYRDRLFREKDVVETEIHHDPSGALFIEWIAPLTPGKDEDPMAFVVLQMSPETFLGPILSTWRTSISGAETVLFRVAAGKLIYLSHGADRTSPKPGLGGGGFLMRELTDTRLLAALVARGEHRVVEALDLYDHPVLGVGRPVSGTTWFVISKVDSNEVNAPLRTEAWRLATNVIVLLIGMLLTGSLVWSNRRNRLLQRQREAESALRRNEERLHYLLTSTPAVIYSLRASGDFRTSFLSDNVKEMTGYPPKDFMEDPSFWIRHLHPGDAPAALAAMSSASSDHSIHREYRFLHSDGSYRWMHDELRLIRDAEGEPLEYVGYWIDVTERKKAVDELRKGRDRLARAEQMAKLGNWDLDLVTNHLSWSEEIYRIFEIDPSRFRASYEAFVTAIHPDDREKVDRCYKESLARHTGYSIQHRLLLPGDRIKYVEESCETTYAEDGTPLRSIGTVQDITLQVAASQTLQRFNLQLEEKVAQRTAELVASNREVQALLQSIPDMVVRLHTDGTVFYRQSSRGMGALDTIDGNKSGLLQRAMDAGRRSLASQGTISSEVELPVNGGQICVELRATPVNEEEFVVFIRDITSRRRLETELASTLAKERDLSDMKGRFIAVTSHEFRTPMATALGSAELLTEHSDRLPSGKRKELIDRIIGSLKRMNSMLDDLLTLNRMDAKRIEAVLKPVDFESFIINLIEDIRLADYGAHEFEFRPKGAPGIISTDPDLVHHILSNLLNNARRYSPAGTSISLDMDVQDDAIEIAVQDDGIGVPEKDRSRLFLPFERGSNVGTIKGTGLGLSIVKRMCDLLDARIYLDTTTNKGSRFVVRLPRNAAPSGEATGSQ